MTAEPSQSVDQKETKAKQIQDAVSQGRSEEEKRREGEDNIGGEEDGEDEEGDEEGGEEDGEEDCQEGEDKETLRSKTQERAKEKSVKGRTEKVVCFTELASGINHKIAQFVFPF